MNDQYLTVELRVKAETEASAVLHVGALLDGLLMRDNNVVDYYILDSDDGNN